MSTYEGAKHPVIAGADLSALTNVFKFVYLDSADSYKCKLATSSIVGTRIGVLQNNPADNKAGSVVFDGMSRVLYGGTVTPWAYVTINSASKAIAAVTGDRVYGRMMPKFASGVPQSEVTGQTGEIQLVEPFQMVGESNLHGTAIGYYKFATDGGAVSTIDLRDFNGNDVVIPTGASILPSSHYRVTTNLTSSGSATVALKVGGLTSLALVAYDNAVLTTAINVRILIALDKTTAATAAQIQIAVAALTAGEMFFAIDWAVVTEGK